MARQKTSPRTVVASAAHIKLGSRNAGAGIPRRQEWQEEALAFRRDVPEIGFATRYVGNQLSKLRLYVGYRPDGADPNDPPVAVNSVDSEVPPAVADAAIAELDRLKSAPHGGRTPSHGTLLRRFAVNLDLVADCYLVGIEGDDSTPEQWSIRSLSEVTITTDGKVEVRDTPGGSARTLRPDLDTCVRLFVSDEEWIGLASSPMQYLLTDCRILQTLTQQMYAESTSRLSAGLLFIASEITFPVDSTATDDPDADPFMEGMMEGMTAPVGDPASASSIVPTTFRVPFQYIKDGIRHVDLGRTPDAKLDDRITKRIDRIARGLDLPVEVVMGHMDTTYANAEQVDQDTFEDHLAPRCVTMVELLTQGFLTPHLAMNDTVRGTEWVDRLEVWFDPAPLLGSPDPTKAADEGHDRFVISDAAWRRVRGFDDDDAPDYRELLMRLAMKRGQMNGDLTGALLRAMVSWFGEDTDQTIDVLFPAYLNPPAAPGSVLPAPPPVQGDAPPAPDSIQASALLELVTLMRAAATAAPPGHPQAVPTATTTAAPEGPSVVAAATQSRLGDQLVAIDRDLRTRIQVAASAAMDRALERAGNRLRAKAGKVRDTLRATPAHECAALLMSEGLWAAAGESTESLLKGSWDQLEELFRAWGAQSQGDALELVNLAVGGFSGGKRSELKLRQARDLDESWGWMKEALDSLAGDRLFDPNPAAGDGEFDPTLKVPPGIVRNAVSRMGGNATIAAPNGDDAWIAAPGQAGVGFGPTLGQEFIAAGGTISGYRWEYGAAARARPFPPHQRLNGEVFDNFDDPILLHSGIFPPSQYLYPGDHKGCVCDFVPLMVEPPPPPPVIPPRVEPAPPEPLTPKRAAAKRAAPKADPAPVVTPPAAPAGTKLPSTVVNYASPAARKAYEPTMQALDRLHGVNQDTMPPLELIRGGKATGGKGGHFGPASNPLPRPRRTRGMSVQEYNAKVIAYNGAKLRPEILILQTSETQDLFTLLHEMGHRIDWQGGDWTPALAKGAGYRFTSPTANKPGMQDMVGFLSAAQQSATIGEAHKRYRNSGDYSTYFTSTHEVWARAYSQWAAHKLGGKHLVGLRETQQRSPYYQWPDDEFELIAPHVENVLRGWGLLT